MSKPVGYTFAIATRNPRQTFVFCKWLANKQEAIDYALNELNSRGYDVNFILIREGVESALDPVIWDSRKHPKPVIWTHTPVPVSFPLQLMHERFERRAASILSDYDCRIDFKVWQPHEKEGYQDYRYKSTTVRAAWMMYLDLALEHFDRFGTVV